MTQQALKVPDYPTVTDDSGYQLTSADFDFLTISGSEAWACSRQAAPLGIPDDVFGTFVDQLFKALHKEGFVDVDVRLQGSSTRFFSNPDKPYPAEPEERVRLFVREHGRLPTEMELSRIEAAHGRTWGSRSPGQRPFDSMHLLGLSPDPSDIDVQISSDAAFRIARQIADARRIPAGAIRFNHPHYNFLIKEISDVEFPHLKAWRTVWQDQLGRGVNVAIFDQKGPVPRKTGVSSHFRNEDWVLRDGGER